MKKVLSISLAVIAVIVIYFLNQRERKVEVLKSYEDLSIEKYSWLNDIDLNTPVDTEKVSRKNYYIIFDGSGSMLGEKLSVAKKALLRFIDLIPAGDNIGITAFDRSGNYERAALGSAKEYLVSRIEKIEAGGATPLGQSSKIAYQKLTEQAKKQLGYGEYNLVIVTDGMATDPSLLDTVVEKILKESPIVIHTIGFHIGTGHPLNQPGRIYYKTAQNYEELSEGLEEVLAEIDNFTITEF